MLFFGEKVGGARNRIYRRVSEDNTQFNAALLIILIWDSQYRSTLKIIDDSSPEHKINPELMISPEAECGDKTDRCLASSLLE